MIIRKSSAKFTRVLAGSLLAGLILSGCDGGSGSGADATLGTDTAASPVSEPTTPGTSSTTTPSATTPSGTSSAGSTMDDKSLASYVCSANIAATPGSLQYLPIGAAGAPQKRGYVEYVPQDYQKKSAWPCIINLHGDGELGDGTTAEKLKVFSYSCLPGMINKDTWDDKHRFIVLSPQFASYDDRSGDNVREFVRFAKANYRIDPTRIYFTAVSGGGVALANYLNKYGNEDAAAILPVSCYVSPASPIIWKNAPVWFLCGAADTTVGPANLVKNYNALVAAKAPVTPRITLYTGVGHDANSVNKSYSPALMDNKLETTYQGIALTPYSNVYDWLLQYQKK